MRGLRTAGDRSQSDLEQSSSLGKCASLHCHDYMNPEISANASIDITSLQPRPHQTPKNRSCKALHRMGSTVRSFFPRQYRETLQMRCIITNAHVVADATYVEVGCGLPPRVLSSA